MGRRQRRRIAILVSIILIIAVDVAVIGMLVYEVAMLKKTDNFLRAAILLGASVVSVWKLSQRYEVRRSAKFYRDTYTDLIGNAFWNDKKLERRFCRALDAYNADQYQSALRRLEALMEKVTRNEDRFAITVFTALCYDDMRAYPQAIRAYGDALRYGDNSTVYSNLGLCLQRTGDFKGAIAAYVEAIRVDPKNDYAYTNAAQLMVRVERYEDALAYAEQACALNQNLMPAHTVRALCHAVLGNKDEAEQAIRTSVKCGADRHRLEEVIQLHLTSAESDNKDGDDET